MDKIVNQLTLITVKDGVDGDGSGSSAVGIYSGICDTLGSIQTKMVVLEKTMEAENGVQIAVRFAYENTSSLAKIQLCLNDEKQTPIGNAYPIYAGDRELTYPDIYGWRENQVINFIFFNNGWYITSASAANAMKFQDGKLQIYNNQHLNGFKAELGDKALDFKIGQDNLAHYGADGVKLYEVTNDEKKQGKPYSQFGPTTILGYEDELEPHLTAQNTYLAMNDSLGEYFRVSRKGLMYKAKKNNGDEQWLGISPDGGIGIINNYEDIKNENKTDMEITPTIKDGEDAISVQIMSSNGNIFQGGNIATVLTCNVKLGFEDITDKIKKFTWIKIDNNGVIDESWTRITETNSIAIDNRDIAKKATFNCSVDIDL